MALNLRNNLNDRRTKKLRNLLFSNHNEIHPLQTQHNASSTATQQKSLVTQELNQLTIAINQEPQSESDTSAVTNVNHVNNDQQLLSNTQTTSSEPHVATSSLLTTRINTKKKKTRRKPSKKYKTDLNTQDADTVINLSNVTLSNAEIKLLSRGLTFVPTPRRITWSEIQADLNEFARRLRLKEYFYNPDDITNTLTNMAHPFKCKSTWTPPSGKEAALDTFINAIEQDLMSAKPTRIHDNLTKQERKAIKQLQRRMDIVIKPADKGSGTVVMDRTWYVNECMRQLNDCNFYQKQSKDLTSKIQERIRKYTSRMHNEKLIDENTFKYLTCNPNPQPGRFYILPKIHKQGNPGRPIISSNGHSTEHISEFVDFHLQPLVKTLPSHIKDTTHFLLKLQELGSLPDNAILVSLDVHLSIQTFPIRKESTLVVTILTSDITNSFQLKAFAT